MGIEERIKKTIKDKKATNINKLLILLMLLVLATRIYPLIRGSITNLETLDTMLVIKQFAAGNTSIIFTESWLQVYLITVPYSILKGFLDITQTMYVIKAALVIFSALIVYLFGKEVGGARRSGYFALLLFAISPIAIYAQSLGLWTGDAISPIFLAASVLFMLYAKANLKEKSLYLWAFLSIFCVIIAYLSWNAGIYAIVTYAFVLILLVLQSLIRDKQKTFLAGIILVMLAFLVYIPSNYNIGIFSGGNYAGGLAATVIQFISNNNYSLYGSGAASNPIDFPIAFTVTYVYQFLLIAGFFTSTLLILLAAYFSLCSSEGEPMNNAFIAIMMVYLIAIPLALSYRRLDSLTIIPIAILAGVGLDMLLRHAKTNPKMSLFIKIVFAVFILYVCYGTILQINDARYPTDLTSDYLSTMQFISSTPANSTFLTNVFDEAPIEYFANRQSAIDGWNGGLWAFPTNASRKFDNFLFASSCNSTYLESTHADYLVVDRFWLYYGYIEPKDANGTNMKSLINGNFQIKCSNLNLILVYDSSYNITKIYKIQNYTPMQGGFKALLSVSQANDILMNNFTLVGEPTASYINSSRYGEISSGYEELVSKNASYHLVGSYTLFRNFSDAAIFYLYSISELKNSTNIASANIGTIFNTTYIYLNTTGNSESITSAVYGNYLLSFKSVGSAFSIYQAKQLLYNQILDMNQNCILSSNSIYC